MEPVLAKNMQIKGFRSENNLERMLAEINVWKAGLARDVKILDIQYRVCGEVLTKYSALVIYVEEED